MDPFGLVEPLYATRDVSYVARTPRAGSSALMQEVSQTVWSVSKELPLANPQTMEDLYKKSLARTSFALVMLGIAGAMAFALGVAGLYGVIFYSVAQRTREIGIRVAMGTQNSEVRRMFIAEGARLAAIGIAVGSVAAFGRGHGGRQANGGIATIDMLPGVVKAAGNTPVLFDSGVRSGSDVVKLLALGATAVGIGRPYRYGLALDGVDGIIHALRSILAEADLLMAIDGYPAIADLRDAAVRLPL